MTFELSYRVCVERLTVLKISLFDKQFLSKLTDKALTNLATRLKNLATKLKNLAMTQVSKTCSDFFTRLHKKYVAFLTRKAIHAFKLKLY